MGHHLRAVRVGVIYEQLYALRFHLGPAEASVFPDIVLCLGFWVPDHSRAAIMFAIIAHSARVSLLPPYGKLGGFVGTAWQLHRRTLFRRWPSRVVGDPPTGATAVHS